MAQVWEGSPAPCANPSPPLQQGRCCRRLGRRSLDGSAVACQRAAGNLGPATTVAAELPPAAHPPVRRAPSAAQAGVLGLVRHAKCVKKSPAVYT